MVRVGVTGVPPQGLGLHRVSQVRRMAAPARPPPPGRTANRCRRWEFVPGEAVALPVIREQLDRIAEAAHLVLADVLQLELLFHQLRKVA
ncbi:hypothetical protein BwSH20_48810 [Bradyrhizobium ottawaense]|nr:hypothetical protein SG09_71540 [Bradyrhizobium ottawaense]GMO42477.1 hypothetical protein BwSF21_54920 [Bradyrhizobium ottawaense]GMO46443.1 hypothetical protein BwSH14_63260 [Bradyrhizobium ottawaense]GMO52815.1 hypothetical protein BwSF12_63980 [Bradyrhizobium ottawaense]GMO76071.1 hypothetical protein BwSF19_20990 [Bradyrhizobium ottawaense]